MDFFSVFFPESWSLKLKGVKAAVAQVFQVQVSQNVLSTSKAGTIVV